MTYGMPTVASDYRLLLIKMRLSLRLATTPTVVSNSRRDWLVLKNEDRQMEFMSEISMRADLNTCTYSELCEAVKEASESILCIPHCKNRCPRDNDIVTKARRELVIAMKQSHNQPSSVHTEVAAAKAVALSAAYDSER